MVKRVAIPVGIGIVLALLTPAADADECVTTWCTLTTTGLPGGPVQHRLAFKGSWTDPLTGVTGFLVNGVNLTTSQTSTGYGITSAGGAFPIGLGWRDGINYVFNPAVAAGYRVNVHADLGTDTRRFDQTPTGNFTAAGTTAISDCTTVQE